jgi:predicted HNH restriction endonuclease
MFGKNEAFFIANILNEIEIVFLGILKESGETGLSAVDVRHVLGFNHYIQANNLISQIGKKYLNFTKIQLPDKLHLYEIVSDPNKNYRDSSGFFRWVIRDSFAEHIDSIISRQNKLTAFYFIEGRKSRIENTHYERNIKARKKCIEHFGCVCKICGFNFYEVYGEIGKEYIEVHHLIPIHHKNSEYCVNPLVELIPVCSNCHSIIHRKNPPFNEDEMASIIVTKNNKVE